jgi:hypothetical protein
VSSATCDWCGEYIEAVRNHRFPGFCSTECRDQDRAVRDRAASDLARRRADANQHRRATEAHKRYRRNYLT